MVFDHYKNNIVARSISDCTNNRISQCFVETISNLERYRLNQRAIASDEKAFLFLDWGRELRLAL